MRERREPRRRAHAELRRVGRLDGARQIERAPLDRAVFAGRMVVVEPHQIDDAVERRDARLQTTFTERHVVHGRRVEPSLLHALAHAVDGVGEEELLEGGPIDLSSELPARGDLSVAALPEAMGGPRVVDVRVGHVVRGGDCGD